MLYLCYFCENEDVTYVNYAQDPDDLVVRYAPFHELLDTETYGHCNHPYSNVFLLLGAAH